MDKIYWTVNRRPMVGAARAEEVIEKFEEFDAAWKCFLDHVPSVRSNYRLILTKETRWPYFKSEIVRSYMNHERDEDGT